MRKTLILCTMLSLFGLANAGTISNTTSTIEFDGTIKATACTVTKSVGGAVSLGEHTASDVTGGKTTVTPFDITLSDCNIKDIAKLSIRGDYANSSSSDLKNISNSGSDASGVAINVKYVGFDSGSSNTDVIFKGRGVDAEGFDGLTSVTATDKKIKFSAQMVEDGVSTEITAGKVAGAMDFIVEYN